MIKLGWTDDWGMRWLTVLKNCAPLWVRGTPCSCLELGVSRSLSGNTEHADWIGLIRDGILRASRLSDDQNWEQHARASLDYAITSNDPSALIGAATTVQKKLQGIGAYAYSAWLEESVGSLEVRDPAVGQALAATGCPLLTTIYDELVEIVTSRPSAVWTRVEGIRDALRNDPPTVGHLHGLWREPGSVVLSDADYERVLGDEPSQHLQSAFYATKAFVFVGYGAGLQDPNFGWMLRTHRRLFPDTRHTHYQLAIDSAVAEQERQHADTNIRVVPYGASHSDLAPFIQSLTTPLLGASVRHDYVSFAREALVDQVRDEAVIGDGGTIDVADSTIDDLVVEPILLPIPHDKFVASQDSEPIVRRPEPLEAVDVYGGNKLVVVAGEEGAGVTTALRWLAFQASVSHVGAAPLFIDARRCRGNIHALDKEVRRQALAQRLIDDKKQPLPPHVLAVDNVVPTSTSAFRSLIEDVVDSGASAIFLGTRQGSEAEVVEVVSGARLPTEVVYLGKPGRGQVVALASLIAPDGHSSLVDQVIEVLRREHLQRTPFNICLLLMLLYRGASSMMNASDTAVLDKYVQLLTGRSGNFLDPRWTLDPQNRESVLSDLARQMVRERRGSMSRAEVHAHFDAYFRSVDWVEDPLETLKSLAKMRVLRVQGESVSFQQSSYLHLFAAKAAMQDSKFLDEVLADPLYFSPIIRHYAALVRNSEKVARQLRDALDAEWPSAPPVGPLYSTYKRAEAPVLGEENGDQDADEQPRADTDAVEEQTAYDWSDDTDARPFPLDDPRGWPLTAQLTWVLDLASRVVRDSDQLLDLDLKDGLFATVLDRWGYLLDLISIDPALDELADTIIEASADDDVSEDERAQERDFIKRQFPPFLAYAGISATLASRKLLLPLDRVDAQDQSSPIYFDTAATLLAASINVPGWARRLPQLAKRYGEVTVVAEFILPLMAAAYRSQYLTEDDRKSLQEFLKIELGQLHEWGSKRERDAWVNEQLQTLARERTLGARERLPEGETAIDAMNQSDLE